MTASITKDKVLVLNRNWQALDETTVEQALIRMATDAVTAIDTETMMPTKWEDWLELEVREGDHAIRTAKFSVRAPTVVVASSYSKMPYRRPKLNNAGIAARDGFRCQYTGKYAPDGNVDHVMPKSKGGKVKSWENMVWCSESVNRQKGDTLPDDFPLKLRRKPTIPMSMPVCAFIKRRADKPEWDMFLPI